MRFINESLLRFTCWLREEKAQTMAEYGLILALVSVVAIAVLLTMGGKIGAVFTDISGHLAVT